MVRFADGRQCTWNRTSDRRWSWWCSLTVAASAASIRGSLLEILPWAALAPAQHWMVALLKKKGRVSNATKPASQEPIEDSVLLLEFGGHFQGEMRMNSSFRDAAFRMESNRS